MLNHALMICAGTRNVVGVTSKWKGTWRFCQLRLARLTQAKSGRKSALMGMDSDDIVGSLWKAGADVGGGGDAGEKGELVAYEELVGLGR